MKMPKVLVAAPTHRVKDYAIQDWCDFTGSLTYPNYERLLVDNSENRYHSVMLDKKMGNCKWYNPKGKTNIQYITLCQEVIRNYAILNNFDYIFSLEVDITPPINNIIEVLMIHNKPVVSAMYYIMMGSQSHLCLQELDSNDSNAVSRNLTDGADMLFVDGLLKRVFHAGMGCSLIRRDVFTKIPFRYIKGVNAHADSFFANDLFENGIDNWVDTSLLCSHDNQDWGKHKHIKNEV